MSTFVIPASVNTDPKLIALARDIAARNELDPAIVCAVIEQESAWDPRAMRYESAFRGRYVSPLGLPPTEEIARSISWGLMQVMGQVAREHGFAGKFLSELCEPEVGIGIGCAVFVGKLETAGREITAGNRSSDLSGSRCMSACKTATLGCVSFEASTPATAGEIYRRALQLWNGGANLTYADQVLQRVATYR